MVSALTTACAICVILCTQLVFAEENCFVVAPNVFRLGTKETIAVMVDGGPKRVTVTLHNHPNSMPNFFYWSDTVTTGYPQIKDIIVREDNVPDLQYERNNVYVTLEVTCGTLWTRQTQVLVSPASGEHFFLQTEKPIYHPGKNVNIRFLAVDGKLKPSESIFRLEVRNPQNVIVERTEFQPSRELLLTHTYQLPDRTLLGEWSLVVKYGHNFQQNTTSTFLVDKYVLPRFKVDLSVPEYILSNFSTLPCTVIASFVNKMPVEGVVQFNFGLKQEVGNVWWFSSSKSPVLLEDGDAVYNLPREHLEEFIAHRLDMLFASQGRLVVKATVTEEATGAKESVQSDKTVFSKTPYVISLRKNQRSFKPGLKIYIISSISYQGRRKCSRKTCGNKNAPAREISLTFNTQCPNVNAAFMHLSDPLTWQAEVTYVSGNPAPNVPMKVTRLNSGQTYEATTGSDGVATFFIPVSIDDGALSIQVATNDQRYPDEHQAREQLTLQPYQRVSEGFIAIERKDPKSVVEVNQLYEAVLFIHHVKKISSSVYYAVLSKGRIQMVQKLPEGRRIEENIVIPVTPEMTPSFRVVVFAVLGRHVVTDSIYVNAQPACTNTSHFTLGRKNMGVASEPMALETLLVKGTPGTRVGVLGVDQALYLLRKKDLLTRDKLFQSLDSKDLGCGAGGGTDAVEALSSSGVVLLTRDHVGNTLRSDIACHEHRRKRGAAIHICILMANARRLSFAVEEYEDETLRVCCFRGQWRDQFSLSCAQRLKILLEQENTHVTQECVDAFKRCCTLRGGAQPIVEAMASKSGYTPPGFYFERVFARPRFQMSANMHRAADYDEMIQFSEELPEEDNTEVREDFRDTWLFHNITIGADGRAEFAASLPSSITTWEVSAVSVSPSGGVCAVDPLEILATKKFFVEVNVPYSVIRNEQIEIPATVYNYGSRHVEAKVMLLGTNDICSGAKLGKPSAIRRLSIPPGRGRTAIFPVVPLAAGVKYIHVKASSNSGESDAVKVELNVLPPGIRKTRSFAVILDPQNSQRRSQRHIQESYTDIFNANGTQVVHIEAPHSDFALPNTEHCEINIVGDGVGAVLETVIKHPGEAVILPTDCGEQATSKLVPALYAYEYFKITNRISPGDKCKTLAFIRRGYDQIFEYRNKDGSFSVFKDGTSSLWLTAYVVRTLCQASKVIMIDECVITSGLRYIASKQRGDGEFSDEYSGYQRRLVGDLQHRAALTAYMLITLEECDAEGFRAPELSKQRAAAFVERHVRQGDSPGGLALAAYALSLANSPGKQNVIQWLQESVHSDQDKGESHVPEHHEVLSAQATSYAIMTFIKERKDSDYIKSFVQWLSKRMSPRGSLQSSKDTVMALQALAKYAIFAKENSLDLQCEVTLSNNRGFNENVRIKRDNATILNKIEINHPGEKIFVNVKGSGTGILYFNYTYNAKVPDDICKFDITANFEEKQASRDKILTQVSRSIQKINSHPRSNLKPNYRLDVCASPLKDAPDGMVIFEVGLLTGFKANVTDLENLIRDKRIDAYNLASRKVDFYVPSISRNMTTCVNFSLEQEFNAGQLQSSYVKVYAYYEPDFSCERFYTPDKSSPLLKFHCDQEDVCTCAEGGCPPVEPLDQFMKDKNDEYFEEEEQHERLREFACDEVDYVWSGKAKRNVSKDGFIEVVFLVTQVLKPGQEDNLENQIRRIKARDNCATLNIPNDEQYIIMGKDSTYVEEDEFKQKQFMYLIDSSSMVFPTRRRYKRKQEKLVAWFIKEFSDETTRCFS